LLARRWLFFIGDSVTRETLYALMTLNGAPPWVNFSVSEEVWRRDIPPAYEIGAQHVYRRERQHSARAASRCHVLAPTMKWQTDGLHPESVRQ
jgi:hypothetical protein